MIQHKILSEEVATITDLKRDPMSIIRESKSGVVAILNRNNPVFYCVTPEMFAYYQTLLQQQNNE